MNAFGRYTLVRRIGAGGMAEIWKAKTLGPSGFVKHLAIKTILPGIADDRTFVSMFVDEAKLAASLVHPNIVQVFDFGEIDGRYFFAMEYVPGGNLEGLLTRMKTAGETLPAPVAAYIALETARGLGCAHTKADATGTPLAIVHRDVSPQNILVSSSGDVKVGDFGIAKAASVASRTGAGLVRGKIAYMSPEQLDSAAGPLDARTDLFSLAIVLYEMFSGTRLFSGRSTDEIYLKLKQFRPEKLDLDGVPPELQMTLVSALQPERGFRLTGVAALETALGEYLGVAGIARARAELAARVVRHFEPELRADHGDETGENVVGGIGDVVSPTAAVPTGTPGRTVEAATLVTPSRGEPVPRSYSTILLLGIAAAVALVAVVMLSGLGGGGPSRGGTLRVALGYDSEPFDLFSQGLTRNRIAMQIVMEPLFRQSRTGETKPWAVASTAAKDGGKRIELTLRPDLVFHDHPCFPGGKGRAAMGADLAFSLRAAVRAARVSLPISEESIEESRDGAAIVFPEPSPFYLSEVAEVRLIPRDFDGCEDLSRMKQPAGTGPFRFTDPPNAHGTLRLERHGRYWSKDREGSPLPFLDAVELEPVSDPQEVLARVGRGELDVFAPPTSQWPALFDLSTPRVRLAEPYRALADVDAASYASRGRVSLFGMMVSTADGPLRDVRVRRAIALGMDRAPLTAASTRPWLLPAGRFLDSRMLGYDAALPEITPDAAEAARLLAAAGHPGGKGLRPIRVGIISEVKTADLLKAQLAPLGIRIEPVAIAAPEILQSLEKGTVDALLATNEWNMIDNEPSTMAAEVQLVGTVPERLAALARELTATPERESRASLYRKIERELLAELPMIPISRGDGTRPVHVYAVHRGVRGFHDPVTGATRNHSFEWFEVSLDRR